MITVCHLSRSRSERIVWLMEELGLPYQLEWHEREATGAAPPSMKAIHAIGKAPIIRDGDLGLAESGAIVEYIVQRHGDGRLSIPPASPDYPRYLYWMHFAEGSLMTLMLMALVVSRIPEANGSPVKKRLTTRMEAMLAFVDAEISSRRYFVGDEFTAADVMMLFPFTTMRRFLEYDLSAYKNILAYVERIEARPAFRKAMELSGPDAKAASARLRP